MRELIGSNMKVTDATNKNLIGITGKIIDETKNRLVNTSGGNLPLKMAATFFGHCLFYLNVIGSYFAPWCIFFIGAVPLAFVRIKSAQERDEGLRLMLVWFLLMRCSNNGHMIRR